MAQPWYMDESALFLGSRVALAFSQSSQRMQCPFLAKASTFFSTPRRKCFFTKGGPLHLFIVRSTLINLRSVRAHPDPRATGPCSKPPSPLPTTGYYLGLEEGPPHSLNSLKLKQCGETMFPDACLKAARL